MRIAVLLGQLGRPHRSCPDIAMSPLGMRLLQPRVRTGSKPVGPQWILILTVPAGIDAVMFKVLIVQATPNRMAVVSTPR